MEHEIHAMYVNTPTGVKRTLQCSCGFDAKSLTWEGAGAKMDKHLASVMMEAELEQIRRPYANKD